MKKRWIWLAAIVLTVAVAAVWMRAPDAPTTVSAITPQLQRVEQTVSCMGVVECSAPTAVALPVGCVIDRVLVKAGDRVAAGDVLAVVDKEATRRSLSDSASLVVLAAMGEEITAPAAGTVMEMGAQKGQYLDSGTPCAVLALDEDVQIRIAIRERDLRTLKQGMTVRVSGDGFDRASYDGVLTAIASTADGDGAGGIVVEGVVSLAENAFDPSLRLGLTARASVVTAVTEEGLLLPYEAVMSDADGYYVYVVEDGQAARKNITVTAQVADGVLLSDDALLQASVIREAESIQTAGQRVAMRGDNG